MQKPEPIDVVMTWVNGDDPAHRAKMLPYLTEKAASRNDIAGATRFTAHKEIFFCVSSVLRFAPFVRKIFIVTNDQNPGLDDFIARNFPDNKTPVEIVNQNTLFEGYEECLPVFNSLSVETVLWRIPGLSENFVYMNDDFLILKPITPEEWFVDDKIVVRGKWKSIPYHELMSRLKVIRKGYRPFGYKDSMINAARAAGFRRKFINIPHNPQPEKKSHFERFYAENPDLIVANANHRFRYKTQYNSQELACLLAVKYGKDVWKPRRTICINITHHGDDYVERKIALSKTDEFLWGCVQSLDQKTPEERRMIYDWLSELYGIIL